MKLVVAGALPLAGECAQFSYPFHLQWGSGPARPLYERLTRLYLVEEPLKACWNLAGNGVLAVDTPYNALDWFGG